MKVEWRLLAVMAAAGACMITLPMLAPGSSDNAEKDIQPNGRGAGTLLNPGQGNAGEAKGAKPGGGGTTSNGIFYHGGPVMLTINVYYIWYGDWSGNSANAILETLASHIGGSPYFNINTTYYDGTNARVPNSVAFLRSTTDNYSRGSTLSDSDIQAIVSSAISSGRLPKDQNGAYFVLTSKDVAESSGFCTVYCGWHTWGTLNGSNIKYSFVGNADRCPSACEAQTTSPNNNAGADAMASVIAHELEEMATDPNLNAWYDRRGYENADKCAWTFGTTYTTSNGAQANMNLGGLNFLIQRNWVNASGGYCALSY